MRIASSFHSILGLFQQSFAALEVKVPELTSEKLATLVFDAMSTRNRSYHGVGHALEMASQKDPAAVLAGLFHDVVYWQVDRGRTHELRALMEPMLPSEEGRLRVGNADILNAVFDCKPGQELTPFSGMNEYLSAGVAEKLLRDLIPPWELVKVLTLIESTIPFRGQGLIEKIESRLSRLIGVNRFPVDSNELNEFLELVVEFANADVMGFAGDREAFLRSSIQLMIENNPAIQLANGRISDWRKAYQKVCAFYATLKPRSIFQIRADEKSASVIRKHEQLCSCAEANINWVSEYLKTHLIVVSLTEAIALETGGDALMELFLPQKNALPAQKVGPETIDHVLKYTAGKVSAKELLESCKSETRELVKIYLETVSSRASGLSKLVRDA